MASRERAMFNGQQVVNGGTFVSAQYVNLRQNQQIPRSKGDGLSRAFIKLTDHVAPNALHDSGEVSDPPKCHPGTRVDILSVLVVWALVTIYAYPIRWLNGPAGAGKSAIMRSFAEMLVERGLLLATFFFFKSDGTRNTLDRLIPTIAYQLCTNLPPLQPWIEHAIELCPLIFNASLAVQIQALIIDPLLHYFYDPNSIIITPFPRVILIDGLDECFGHENQEGILQGFCKLVQALPIPIAIVFASRPEHHIRATFEMGRLGKVSSRITLDNSFKPDDDIRHFYLIEFDKIRSTHPLRTYLESQWPPHGVIEILVHNASGQFIYAATVMKFIKSNRHNPAVRLQVILGQVDQRTSKPFQQLDLLYMAIFRNVDPEILPDTLRVLGIILTPPPTIEGAYQSPSFIESWLGFPPGHIRSLLLDLESLLTVTDDTEPIRFFHTSLSDFIFDKSRADDMFIDRGLVYADIAASSINASFLRNRHVLDSLQVFSRVRGVRVPHRRMFDFNFEINFARHLQLSLQKATPTDSLRRSIICCDMNQIIDFQSIFGASINDPLAKAFLVGVKNSPYPDSETLYGLKIVHFGKAVYPQMISHWLKPGHHFGQLLPLILLFVHTPASIEQVVTFLMYFSLHPSPAETVLATVPGILEGAQGRISHPSTPIHWQMISALTLDIINNPTGLLHDPRGKQACTDLTVHLLWEVAKRHQIHGGEAIPEPENFLCRILPFLLNASLAREDLVRVIKQCRDNDFFPHSNLQDDSEVGIHTAIDFYISRSATIPRTKGPSLSSNIFMRLFRAMFR